MTPLEILQKTAETVAERGACYGESDESLAEIAEYWDLYLSWRGFKAHGSVTPHDVALMMALLKMARVRSSPGHKDNYIDMAGYAALAGNLANAQNTED